MEKCPSYSTHLQQSISTILQSYRFHTRDSSEDFEVQAAALLWPPIDEDRSNIWTFTLFFCAISKARRSMKGYLKERMTYKRILETGEEETPAH